MNTAPRVRYGTQQVQTSQFGNISLPTAFINRMNFDASVGAGPWGMPTLQDIMSQYFRPAPKGMYRSYAGIQPYLEKVNAKYEGQGVVGKQQQAYADMYKKFRQQQSSDAVRTVSVNASGNLLSDTGPAINRGDLNRAEQSARTEEKKLQKGLMNDLQGFKDLSKTSVTSNLPVTINPGGVRSSMQRHLDKISSLTP